MKLKEAHKQGYFNNLDTFHNKSVFKSWSLEDPDSEKAQQICEYFENEIDEFKNVNVTFIRHHAVKDIDADKFILAKSVKIEDGTDFEGNVAIHVINEIPANKNIMVRGYFDGINPLPENYEPFKDGENGHILFFLEFNYPEGKELKENGDVPPMDLVWRQTIVDKELGDKIVNHDLYKNAKHGVPRVKNMKKILDEIGYKFDNNYNIVKNGEE